MSKKKVRHSRQVLYPQIKEARENGLTWKEIADPLDLQKSTVQDYYNDPTGEKAKARKLKGSCVGCGATVRSDAPLCKPCRAIADEKVREGQREEVRETIRKWFLKHGQAPSASEWQRAAGEGPRDADGAPTRLKGTYAPATVQQLFGFWNEAIQSAGLTPSSVSPSRSSVSARKQEVAELDAEGLSRERIARRMGVHEHTVDRYFDELTAEVLDLVAAGSNDKAIAKTMGLTAAQVSSYFADAACLVDKYKHKGRSTAQIAKRLNIDASDAKALFGGNGKVAVKRSKGSKAVKAS